LKMPLLTADAFQSFIKVMRCIPLRWCNPLRIFSRQVRDWRISCLVILAGSTSCLAIAQDIPAGPKLERYTQLWERNPFAPAAVISSAAQPSALDGLFLSSWLREDSRDVIFVENLQTKDVVRITTEPNQDKLRLVRMNVNANPQLMEAVISDGNEQRAIKFRFESQAAAGTANGEPGQPLDVGNAGAPGSAAPPAAKQPNAQGQAATENPQGNQGKPYRLYPGLPRVHHEGGLPPPQGTPTYSGKRMMSRSESVQPIAAHP
jgi:hypothetical protein